MLSNLLLYLLICDLLTFLSVSRPPWQFIRHLRPAPLPIEQPSMAASEGPSHFTVHVFLSHDPMIAHALLPELFSEFPESAWKLAPLIEPPRPRETLDAKDFVWKNTREVVGRYVLPEPVSGDTTLLRLSEEVEREFGILRMYQGQFTIFPQDFHEEDGYPPWHDRALPWTMTLADVRPLDRDALGTANTVEITKTYAPILHLVLETKAAALMRIVGGRFLDEEIGEPYRLFRGLWNRYDSFWHCHGWKEQSSQLASTLRAWRRATFAHAYLAKQRDEGQLGPENDELKAKIQRVEEIRDMKRQGGLSLENKWNMNTELSSHLLPRIRQIEANEANGKEQLRDLSVFVTQWEDWITNKEFQSFAIRTLEQDDVESRVASVFRQRRQVISEWKSSECRRQLQASIENEYYAARPWLTEEDRARAERNRLETLERAEQHPPDIPGKADATTGYSLVPSTQIRAHSMRRPDGKLLSDRSIFTVSSGSLLWGQILCQYFAMLHPGFTESAKHVPPELDGGTVLQHLFTYRSAARNGQWKVRQCSKRARAGGVEDDPDAPERHVGWILYHENVDPMNALARVRALDGTGPGAVSNRNRHTDKDILYVGRYDWSHHFRTDLEPDFQRWAETVIGPIPETSDPYSKPKCNVQRGGYFIAIDEARFGLDFVAAYKRDCDREDRNDIDMTGKETVEKVFRKDGTNFGGFLSMPHTESEFGWLVFSGEQHADHDVDELVAIVYDGSYEVLESLYHSVEGEYNNVVY